VAEIRLDGADEKRSIGWAPLHHGAESLDLYRVSEWRAGPVGFDVVDVVRCELRAGERFLQHRPLSGAIRHRQAAAAPIRVYRGTSDHGEDRITGGEGVGQALDGEHGAALGSHEAVGESVECLARAVGRHHSPLGEQNHRVG
jgi:hypothetical protein